MEDGEGEGDDGRQHGVDSHIALTPII